MVATPHRTTAYPHIVCSWYSLMSDTWCHSNGAHFDGTRGEFIIKNKMKIPRFSYVMFFFSSSSSHTAVVYTHTYTHTSSSRHNDLCSAILKLPEGSFRSTLRLCVRNVFPVKFKVFHRRQLKPKTCRISLNYSNFFSHFFSLYLKKKKPCK